MGEFSIINPYNNQVLDRALFCKREEVIAGIEKLERGLKTQAALPAFARADILRKLAEIMQAGREDLARQITLEMGKTIGDSRIEIDRATTTIICSAEEARRQQGTLLDSDAFPPMRNKTGLVYRRPIGVVLAITPFNFPINLAAHKIGPAFAAGNTIIFKPHPQTYLSSKIWADMCYQAGMPEDTLKLCLADFPEVTAAIEHASVTCINFTGSTGAGLAIATKAGFKKLLLELGGNDPLIVLEDADLDAAVAATVNQRFGTAGQRCTAAKRLFVHEKIYEAFVEKLRNATIALKVGDPMLDETFVGPVINSAAADSIMRVIDSAIKDGATVIHGNKREGNIIHPTILADVRDHSHVVCKEVFGPVVPLRKISSHKEAIPLINGAGVGLQAGLFTNNLAIIKEVFEALEVGALAINDGPGFRAEHFPFGGIKGSGIGREGVAYAMQEMSVIKTLIL